MKLFHSRLMGGGLQEAFCFVMILIAGNDLKKLDHRQNTEIRNGIIKGPRKTMRAGRKEVRLRD